MRGRYVARKGGWDCHGLPVEVEVEKELGLSGKTQIRDFGIEEFNRRCRESVHRYVEEWSALTERMGMWLDTDGAYWTLTNDYIETVWWLIRQMWDKGLLYEGFKVVPYCGRCGTALSSHEVAQGYKDITEDSVYVRFPVVDRDFEPAGVDDDALDAHLQRGRRRRPRRRLRAGPPPGIDPRRRARPRPGRRRPRCGRRGGLGGRGVGPRRRSRRTPLRAAVRLRAHRGWMHSDGNRVVVADFVTTDDGSGIVHLAPAFGEVDREVGDAEGLPTLNPVDAAGRFEPVVEPWAGLFVKEADPGIIDALRAAGRLEKVQPYEHSYPHCWRCGTPLIYYAKTSWFARTQAEKAALLEQNETIAWHPEHIKHGRFGDWLENNIDWALSRDRYWGTPLPVWRCSTHSPRHVHRFGGRAGRALGARPVGARLHRPYIDEVTFPCPVDDCGAWRRASSPSSTPGSTPARCRRRSSTTRSPATVRRKGLRGPVPGRLHLRGHRPDPRLVLLAAGREHAGLRPDAVPQRRLPGPHRRPGRREDVEVEGQRDRPLGDLQHQGRRRAALVLLLGRLAVDEPPGLRRGHRRVDAPVPPHAVEHGVVLRHLRQPRGLRSGHPGRRARARARPVAGRSRREATVAAVTDALEEYDTLAAAQALEAFVDDLSNWYVRRSRPRFWKSSDPGRLRRPPRCAVHRGAAAGAVLPVRGRRDLRGVEGSGDRARPRSTWRTGRWPTPAWSTPASRPRWPWPAAWWPSGGPPGGRPG